MYYFCAINAPNTSKHVLMNKLKITLEYELNTRSPFIIWNLISTTDGLSNWVANNVEQKDNDIIFTWGEIWGHHEIRYARIVNKEKNRFIRFKWNDDTDDNDYWELRIEQSKETDEYLLIITDFADNDDPDGLKYIWNENMNRLHQASGI